MICEISGTHASVIRINVKTKNIEMKTRLIFFLIGAFILIIVASSFTLLYTSCISANSMIPSPEYKTYDQDWKKVDSLQNKGLPKSALEVVESIYSKAKKENNHPQFIKATLYKLKLKSDFEEDFMESTISDIKNEIEKTNFPDRQILHSIEAELYWRYYQANRYKLLDRSQAINVDLNDIRTWDMKTLVNKVIKNYLASLEDAGN